MTWTETILLSEPVRDVVGLPPGGPLPEPACDWEARLREAEDAGFKRGRLEGEKALREQLLHQRAEMLEIHQGVIEALRRAVPGLVSQTENALVTLALETARRLVAGQPVSPEMVAAVVQEALGQIENATEFHIQLHPEDLALLERIQSPLLTPAPGGDKFHFHASTDVTRGGCLVRTCFGVLDAQRETKIEQLKKSLGLPEGGPASPLAMSASAA
jgi:flagellar assembly protein FliH